MLDRNESMRVISGLKEISSELNSLYYGEILKLEDMLQENKYKVAIIGEFSSGKSTFLNAISGKRILYSSPKEATGVVTFLENSMKKSASVLLESGKVEEISLSSEECYQSLKRYLDIKNSDSQIVSVGINYPLSNIDKEVVFMDTPGLQGISHKQMEITRDILKEANATIMLITKKGFSKTELDLLTGKNLDFGRINTKEIFVVINKIGEIYDGKTEPEALEKIQEVIDSVKEKLKENNLEHIKVFALDSRDYLWSKDNELYNQIKKNNIEEVKTLLSQKDYEKRSSFNDFKEYLFNFLEEGNRNVRFLEDINNKIFMVIDAFNEVLADTNNSQAKSRDKLLLQLDLQKKLLLDNRRKLYNTLVRYISNSFDEFLRTMSLDLDTIKKIRNKEIASTVEERFISFKSLTQENVNYCSDLIKKYIEKDCSTFQTKLNEYQEVMYYSLVQKKFNDEFMAIFNLKSNLKLTESINKINIDLKFNDVKLRKDSILEEIKKEFNEVDEKIKNINTHTARLKNQAPEYMVNSLEQKKNDAKRDMERKKLQLGSRPEPEQKYRWVTRTRRKWLIFKEEYEEEVPDGFDYSRCHEWDKKSQKITNEFFESIDKLDDEQEHYREMIQYIKTNDELVQSYARKKLQLKEEERKAKENIEKRRKKSEQLFLDGKKEEIYVILEKLKDKSFEDLLEQVKDKTQYMNNQIKEKVKQGIEGYLEKYSNSIDQKISEMFQSAEVSGESFRKTSEKLDKLKEMIS